MKERGKKEVVVVEKKIFVFAFSLFLISLILISISSADIWSKAAHSVGNALDKTIVNPIQKGVFDPINKAWAENIKHGWDVNVANFQKDVLDPFNKAWATNIKKPWDSNIRDPLQEKIFDPINEAWVAGVTDNLRVLREQISMGWKKVNGNWKEHDTKKDTDVTAMSETNYRIYRYQVTDIDLQKQLGTAEMKGQKEVPVIVSVEPNTETKVISNIEKGIVKTGKENSTINGTNIITGKAILNQTKKVAIITNFTSGGFVKTINVSKKDENGHYIEEDELIAQGNVVRLEPNRKSYFKQEDMIHAPEIIGENLVKNSYGFDGTGETICVIDSGINFQLPDIKSRSLLGCNVYCNEVECKEDCTQSDLYGHGTKVASIIGAITPSWNYEGVATGSKIISVKIFKDGEEATTDLIRQIKAIDWCVDNSKKYNISVISMSIGGKQYEGICDSTDAAIKNAVFKAFANNIPFIASAGNEGFEDRICTPSCISKSISVGMTYKDNYENEEVQCFNQNCNENCTDSNPKKDEVVCSSNRNQNLTRLFAPGYDLFTMSKDGNYYLSTGTSMATPVISGSIAVINQALKSNKIKIKPKYQKMNPKDIESLLWVTGDKISNTSYSRINVNNAIKEIIDVSQKTTGATGTAKTTTNKTATTKTSTSTKISYQKSTGIAGFFDNIFTKIKSLFS